jgi:hypothetical protein
VFSSSISPLNEQTASPGSWLFSVELYQVLDPFQKIEVLFACYPDATLPLAFA